VLLYVKSCVLNSVDFSTLAYKCRNPKFPHESTLDQFFDVDQFDAYFDVGYNCVKPLSEFLRADQAISTPSLGTPDSIWVRYVDQITKSENKTAFTKTATNVKRTSKKKLLPGSLKLTNGKRKIAEIVE
jgi:hypothetical protein